MPLPHPTSFSGHIVDIPGRRIYDGTIIVSDGTIAAITPCDGLPADAPYLLPGFIDSHVHIESSMMTPAAFAAVAVRHGTVGAVADPHEIANVLGTAGIDFMTDNARQAAFHFCFGAPSCGAISRSNHVTSCHAPSFHPASWNRAATWKPSARCSASLAGFGLVTTP